MGKQSMYKLKEMLCEELETIAHKGELSAGDLDTIHKLTDTIKNIDKIEMLDNGYSEDGGWTAEGNYGNGNSYSYGGRRRDSMGRYSGNRHGMMYSRADSKEAMISQLEQMMNTSDLSSSERSALSRAMDVLRG